MHMVVQDEQRREGSYITTACRSELTANSSVLRRTAKPSLGFHAFRQAEGGLLGLEAQKFLHERS